MAEESLPTPFRPLPIRAMNATGRVLERVGIQPIRLDEHSLTRAASKATGLEDYGDERFRPALGRLLRSLEEDARLTLFGRFFARRQLIELLLHRLHIVDHRKRHPDVAERRVERPIFVLGLPRTGTTLLYGLLAEDPAARAPLSWEVDEPNPPPETATYATDPRIERTEKRFEQLRQLAPGFQTIHPIGASMPQECIVLMASEFMSIRFEMSFDVSGYQEWLPEQDMASAYRFHHVFLQHLQWRCPGGHWVLKSPGHLGALDALLAEYPDARIVQTHRDPLRVIPSVSSLEYTMRMVCSDHVDPVKLGRQQLRLWKTLLDRCVDTRGRRPELDARIVDLHFDEIVRDPMGCVRRVYERFDLPLDTEAEARMLAYVNDHPRDKHGVHRYGLADFGLDQESVDEAFKGYRERFGVEREPYEG